MNDLLKCKGEESPRWRVCEVLHIERCVKLFDRVRHLEEIRELAEINEEIIDGTLVLLRDKAPAVPTPLVEDPLFNASLQTAMDQIRAIEEVSKQQETSINKAYLLACQNGNLPSRATIYRRFAAKRDERPLLKGNACKGNRKERYGDEVIQLICKCASSLYLSPGSTWKLKSLHDFINDQAHENQLLQPGRNISRKYIQKVIYNNVSVDPELDRMDPKLAAAAKSKAPNRIKVSAPFERVEQDAVHLPFVVNTPYGASNSVYLIHAIDCCTGMVVGWHLFLGAPSEAEGLKCIESILYPKSTLLASLGLKYEIDIYGSPHQLIFDNGPETKGERMSKLVRLGIDAMHCKSRHAHGKPFIERLNRSLKEALETLPGSTRVDGKDGQRDPVALQDTLMNLDTLHCWIVRWYFEAWGNTTLKRHLRSDLNDWTVEATPIGRWKQLTEHRGMPLPLSPPKSDWLMTLYEHETRVLSPKTGVTCRGFNYRGHNLAYLVNKYGHKELRILVNPEDYRRIWVLERDDTSMVELVEEFVTDASPAYSFAQMKEKIAAQKSQQAESPTKAAFRRDVHEQSVVSASGKRKSSKHQVNQDIVKKTKEAKAVQRAAQNPLTQHHAESNSDITFNLSEVRSLAVFNNQSGEKLP